MVNLNNVTVEFGTQLLYKDVNLTLGERDRVGLVGPNGSGKSTILRMIAGESKPSSGTVQLAKGLRVGYLPQTGATDSNRTVLEEALTAFGHLERVHHRMVHCEHEMSRPGIDKARLQALLDRYAKLQHEYEADGYDCEARAKKVLVQLGFRQDDFEKRVRTQSGGFKVRLTLARMLLQEPDLLLLDEPTNYLDIRSIEWLQSYLAAYKGALLMIAHDRYLLDGLVQRIWAIEKPKVLVYNGNYSDYLENKEERDEQQQEAYEAQQAFIKRTETFIAKFKGRKDTAPRAMSRQKMLDKLERIEAVRETKTIRIEFPEAEEIYGRAFELRDVGKQFGGRWIFTGVHLSVKGGEKIGLFGANGSGKTTLLRMLAGRLKPDRGDLWMSQKISIAYYEQGAEDELVEDLTVFETVARQGSGYTENQLKGILGVFLFKGDEVDKKVRVLSGGERSRLALVNVLLTPSNLLILDEPTNHLDIQSREVLFDAISRYERTVVFAAHDRYMLDRLADKTVRVEAGEVVLFPGNYTFASAQTRKQRESAKPREHEPGVPVSTSKTQRQETKVRGQKQKAHADVAFHKPAVQARPAVDSLAELRGKLEGIRKEYEQARQRFDLNRARQLAQQEKEVEEEMARVKAEQVAGAGEEATDEHR